MILVHIKFSCNPGTRLTFRIPKKKRTHFANIAQKVKKKNVKSVFLHKKNSIELVTVALVLKDSLSLKLKHNKANYKGQKIFERCQCKCNNNNIPSWLSAFKDLKQNTWLSHMSNFGVEINWIQKKFVFCLSDLTNSIQAYNFKIKKIKNIPTSQLDYYYYGQDESLCNGPFNPRECWAVTLFGRTTCWWPTQFKHDKTESTCAKKPK